MRGQPSRRLVALFALVALTASACSGNEVGGRDKRRATLVFATTSDPASLDGAYVSDTESLRVIDQVFEGLLTAKTGETQLVGELAASWSSSDGIVWTFNLREGVKFHDGTPLDAQAVCFNFDRWYNFKGIQQSPSVAYYWTRVFGGFAKNESPDLPPSLYKACTATDDRTVVITLVEPSSSFLAALAMPAFSIASPAALTKYEADKVSGTADSPVFDGSFGSQHPVGTGPFQFESFVPNRSVVLTRNDDYWGQKARLDGVVFRPIPDPSSRRQALESGEIHGYADVGPDDVKALAAAGYQVLRRPAFNLGYVGLNQAKPPLDNLKIRQAIAHALNRDALVKAMYPPGAEVAKAFQPPRLFGYSEDVTTYAYDLDKAKRLIKESGVRNLNLEFWYPTAVTRAYMPDPAANAHAFAADLEAVGFTVTTRSAPWTPDYRHDVGAGRYQMYLYGWTGDYGDPDNFVGTFFRSKQDAWGFDNPELFKKLDDAEKETDQEKRAQLYEEANELIMNFLPGVPYVHTKPSLAFAKNVKGYKPSPVSLEPFSIVSLG